MEEYRWLSLGRMIGVNNFTTNKLQDQLAFAKIPLTVNQVYAYHMNQASL
jgi:diketogulonate reductase-like aldo/keto reductase